MIHRLGHGKQTSLCMADIEALEIEREENKLR
jgi:hypothetical protein